MESDTIRLIRWLSVGIARNAVLKQGQSISAQDGDS